MIKLGKAPWTLWVYTAVTVAGVVFVEAQVHGPVAPRAIYPLFMLAYLYFLLRGVRWLWIVTLVVLVLSCIATLASAQTWYLGLGNVSLGVAVVALLLLPLTRRYFAREQVAAT